MKPPTFHFAFLALIALVLSPLAVAHAIAPPADNVHFCAPFDYEQWRRDHPRPAGKRLATLDTGEPRTVRMIYFLPNDDPYRADEVDGMKTTIRRVQTFYAEQMQAHGQGNTTFRFETDAQGEPVVHRVDGRHPTRHYKDFYEVFDEIEQVFDVEANVYLVFTMNFAEGGPTSKSGGVALVGSYMGSGDYDDVVAHELGHAFGLDHDFRDEAYVMSYGIGNRLSACSAEFLTVYPYFNPNSPIEAGSLPTIEQLTPSLVYTEDVTSVPIRIRARDSDGLHQVLLLVGGEEIDTHFQAKACRGLAGEREAIVEFDYDGIIPSIRESDLNSFGTQELIIRVVDALGDATWSDRIELVNRGREPIATLVPEDWVTRLLFSSDSRLLASGSYDGTIEVWDVSGGKAVASLKHKARSLAFSPDSRLLASGGADEGTIKLWDVSSGETVGPTLVHEDGEYPGVSSLAFSPDSRLLASGGADEYVVKLWDVSSGKTVATFPGNRGTVGSLVFSPDGRLLASGSFSGTIEVWDVSSGETVTTFRHEEVSSLAFSPDGRLLASGDNWNNTVVKLWDVSTGQSIATLLGSGPVSFSPDGRLLASRSVREESQYSQSRGGVTETSVYGGNRVKLWDVSTGQSIATLPLVVSEVAFSPDGRLLASGGGNDGTIEVWDMAEWTQSSGQVITGVELEGISSSHDSIRENGAQATIITLTVTLDKAAAADETITLAIVSPLEGKTAKRNQDFDATLDETITIAKGWRTGTAQLTLTPKDNTTADGDKVFGVQATSSSGHSVQIDIKIADGEMDDGTDGEDDSEMNDGTEAFAFAEEVEDQAYTAGTAISALVLPEATGGEGEVAYSVSELPSGLSFDGSARTISGTPEAATDGAIEVTYTAEDSAGAAITLTFSITVNPALSFGDFFDLFGGG